MPPFKISLMAVGTPSVRLAVGRYTLGQGPNNACTRIAAETASARLSSRSMVTKDQADACVQRGIRAYSAAPCPPPTELITAGLLSVSGRLEMRAR